MQKIIMLGTGHGFVYNCYNTCFLLQNDDEYFLIDTGGSAHIVQNLEKLNIYCNDEVANAIKNIYPNLFPDVYVEEIDRYLKVIVLQNNETKEITNRKYTFFDVIASKNKLYGFETLFDNNKKLVFLGDETCNPLLYDRIKNSDYVMHEAFCLDSEQDIFKPYEKKHSTVKSVCENFANLNIKNLILCHTEDTHLVNRKELYTKEAQKYFNGNVIVPNDLEFIEIN